MPGWHARTKDLDLKVVGIVQEQHPDRARLYMQWQQMDWPVLADPYNELQIKVVPITLLIDRHGIIRYRNPKASDLKKFLDTDYPERPKARAVTPPEKNDLRTLKKLIKAEPGNARGHFRLGVAYRARFDSEAAKPDDFALAIHSWQQALALQPDQYIWRRRIQQYGPRLDKPYAFYDWVPQARKDLLKRGEKPHPLPVEPKGSEFADAGKFPPRDIANPPPTSKGFDDDEDLIKVSKVVVPSTKGDRKAVRVHLTLTPNAAKKVHWSNDAGPVAADSKIPVGYGQKVTVTLHDLAITAPPKDQVTSSEVRHVEFELRPKEGKILPDTASIYLFYYVCEDTNGTCQYLAHEVTFDFSETQSPE